MYNYYSNEIVFRGHPDKVCDQISDALLDAYLKTDRKSRCGIEVMGGKGKIFITGEVTSSAKVDVKKIVKRVLRDVGYSDKYKIINNLGIQSPDIAMGVDRQGAGDNGMMFGYACNDTPQKLPKAMAILQELSMAYDVLRRSVNGIRPDGKAQITGEYDGKKLMKIKTFTICYQNDEKDRKNTDKLLKILINDICKKYKIEIETILINPTGRFEIGGFEGDAGLTGRKIVVDSYQSFANVGGGAFSGKDPSKVDRSGAYKAREIAKQLLDAGELQWCEVQLSYAIGMEKPLAIYINSDKGVIIPPEELYEECKPRNIINHLKLLNECYEERAKFGHFR